VVVNEKGTVFICPENKLNGRKKQNKQKKQNKSLPLGSVSIFGFLFLPLPNFSFSDFILSFIKKQQQRFLSFHKEPRIPNLFCSYTDSSGR